MQSIDNFEFLVYNKKRETWKPIVNHKDEVLFPLVPWSDPRCPSGVDPPGWIGFNGRMPKSFVFNKLCKFFDEFEFFKILHM